MISPDMTVARLLDEHPNLVEVLAGSHPHFKLLRHQLLRRLMAPRVTVAQAARIAGMPADELLATLRRAVGEPVAPSAPVSVASEDSGDVARPAALAHVPEARRIHLDVREGIKQGREPFAQIMTAVRSVGADQVLILRAPFEPIPLYDVLGKRGFAHWTQRHAPDDWSVWFYRDAAPAAGPGATPTPASAGSSPGNQRAVLDVRGLEPPQPMVRVLEALDGLGPDRELEVRHDRRPLFLYPQIEERGFTHETDEPEPGLVRIRIRRAASAQ